MTDNGLEYQLADKDGNTYEGDFIYVSEKTPEAIFVVDFNFDDINVSVEGELTELSANKLVLNSEGESFVLTRTDEGGMKPFSEILPWESWNLEN